MMDVARGWIVGLTVVAGLMAGCGGGARSTPREHDETSAARPAATSGGSARRSARPAPLLPLRPDGSDVVLDRLAGAPTDAAAHAAAARFFANTDAAGMSLIWGTAHAALGGTDPAVPEAMLSVLRGRVTATSTGTTRSVSTRLAPGAVPVLVIDGVGSAPVAHLYEIRVSPALAIWGGSAIDLGDLTAIVRAISESGHPGAAGFDAHVELVQWIAALTAAGHLDAFVARLFAVALPEQAAAHFTAHPEARAALEAFVAAHPFRPTHAVMPDDLVSFP